MELDGWLWRAYYGNREKKRGIMTQHNTMGGEPNQTVTEQDEARERERGRKGCML
jgi:hypothetical protein